MFEKWSHLADFRNTKEDQWRVRAWLQAAVYVVDVDVGLAQARCDPSNLPRSVRKFDLDDFCLCACQLFAVQCFLGCRRIVYDESSHALPSYREGMKRENVHIAIGERPADFSERARPILH